MTLLLSLFLLLLPVQELPPRTVAGVVVEETAGDLTEREEEALKELHRLGISLPDTVRVQVLNDRYGSITKRGTVILSPERNRPPLGRGERPYLYGRENPTAIGRPGEAYTLLHEIAHHLQWIMFNGRPQVFPPMWWKREKFVNPYREQTETEADLMAAALHEIVFDTSHKVFGYPKQLWAGDVEALVDNYKAKILDYYRVTNR